MILMKALFTKLLILGNSLLLVLPPGLCCVDFPRPDNKAARPASACCRLASSDASTAQDHPADPSPSTPTSECVCKSTAVLPARVTTTSPQPGAVATCGSDAPLESFGSVDSLRNSTLFELRPPLYVRHCVWLC